MQIYNSENVSIPAGASDYSLKDNSSNLFKEHTLVIGSDTYTIPRVRVASDVYIRNNSGAMLKFRFKTRRTNTGSTYVGDQITRSDKDEWSSSGLMVEDILVTNTDGSARILEVTIVGVE